ncbi:hypothetical protein B7463_g1857, partial [Scytalidium lignicola]
MSRVRDRFSLLVLKLASPRDKPAGRFARLVKLQRSQLAPTGMALHRSMYEAFAEGDTTTLRRLCTDGVYDSFSARIRARPRGEKWLWEIIKYNRSPKLISDRGARFPVDGAAVRQAVVKIASKQKLTRFRGDGQVVPGTGKEKDIVEYVVLQKVYRGWKGGEWKVWGTTEETTLEEVLELEKRQKEA